MLFKNYTRVSPTPLKILLRRHCQTQGPGRCIRNHHLAPGIARHFPSPRGERGGRRRARRAGVTQFFGNFQLLSTIPPTRNSLIIHQAREVQRFLPSVAFGTGKDAKQEKQDPEVRIFASLTIAQPQRTQSRSAAGRGRCLLGAAAQPLPRPHLPRPSRPSLAKFLQPPAERAPGTSTARLAADGADQPGCGARQKGSWETLTGPGLGKERASSSRARKSARECSARHLFLSRHRLPNPSDPRLLGALPPRR